MCLSPIRIRTNRLVFDPKYDRLYNTVPCGRCAECRAQKQREWSVRSYYEYKDCEANGGYAIFLTLTYAPKNLPTLYLHSCDKVIACFRKSDVQRFTHNLRKRLKRQYKHDVNFRYIFVSEYGGNTHRPHYHGVMFFHEPIDFNDLMQDIRDLWCLEHGFISFGKYGAKLVNADAAKYVTKYITKDLDFNSYEKDIRESYLIHALEGDIWFSDNVKYRFGEEPNKSIYKYVRNEFAPFHINSQGYGANAYKYCSIDEIVNGVISYPVKNDIKLVSLPLYLLRKYFYTYNKDAHCYVPKPDSIDILCNISQKREPKQKEKVYDFCNNIRSIMEKVDPYKVYLMNTLPYYSKAKIIRMFEQCDKEELYLTITDAYDYMYFYTDELWHERVHLPVSKRERLERAIELAENFNNPNYMVSDWADAATNDSTWRCCLKYQENEINPMCDLVELYYTINNNINYQHQKAEEQKECLSKDFQEIKRYYQYQSNFEYYEHL